MKTTLLLFALSITGCATSRPQLEAEVRVDVDAEQQTTTVASCKVMLQ